VIKFHQPNIILNISAKHEEQLKGFGFDDFMSLRGLVVRAAANRKTMRLKLAGQSYFIKQHGSVGWKEILKNYLAAKKPIIGALTEVSAIEKVTALGIKTTPIAAYGVKGNFIASQKSFLLTEDLGDIVSLEDICKKWKEKSPTSEERKSMLIAVAKLAARFHGAGMCHRDFYLCHIALKRNKVVTSNTEFYLLDLHRVMDGQDPHGTSVKKDIAGLIFSCMDYGFTHEDWKTFKLYYLPQSDVFWNYAEQRAGKLYRKFYSTKFQERLSKESIFTL
jgi:hypothetical protein